LVNTLIGLTGLMNWSDRLSNRLDRNLHHSHSMNGKEKVEQSVPEGEKSKVVKGIIKIGNNDLVMGVCFKGTVIRNGSAQN
jgi:hypothetical protein